MWHRPHQNQPQCSMERLHHSASQRVNHPHTTTPSSHTIGLHAAATRRCAPPHHRAYLHFPPPPNYPPYPSTSKMDPDHHLLSNPGPSTSRQADNIVWEIPPPRELMPNDYSYAYYVPGPPTRHTNVPTKYPGTYREGSYRTRHTYLTRYGTEENIYEEISEVARARMMRPSHHQESMISLNQSLVEEEVRRVQSGHRRVLGELNLSVEAMLMPSNSREGSDDTDREGDDQLADLLTVGPTDELLSPVPIADLDSGFSGSSSGASYRSTAGSLRRGPERPKSSSSYVGPNRTSTPSSAETSSGKGFWGKKAWKKIASFPSNINLNKHKGEWIKFII